MSKKIQLSKGSSLEEVLRAYFLRAGFFVVRGVPFRFADEDLTDVDLWLYERPTGTSRRVQICDIKYKQKPKAVERIFWTSGLSRILNVDGAYVATTDKRASLRSVAAKLDLKIIDGNDIQRIQNSHSVLYEDRISDEQLNLELRSVDKELRNKFFQDARFDILTSLAEGFGAASAVRALEGFARLASATVGFHPNSNAARAGGRLVYLAAAIVCQSLDYVSVGAAFRTLDERRALILDAIRMGAMSNENGQQAIRLAIALVEKYAPSGKNLVESGLKADLDRIPAEIIADQAIQLLKADKVFVVGRELEMACYQNSPPPFDLLSIQARSMVGSLLDYSGIDRERFAQAWSAI